MDKNTFKAAMLTAIEFGYKACERGDSLTQATIKYLELEEKHLHSANKPVKV